MTHDAPTLDQPETDEEPAMSPPTDRPVRLPRLPVAIVVAAVAGAAMLFAFPPFDLWWLAPPAVALFALVCHRRRVRAGIGLGLVFGIAFFAPLLSWTSTQVGQFPWIALSLLQALYFAALGGALAAATRVVDRHRGWWPVIIGVLWVGQEALRSRTPFDGFPWGRLAFSQADSPLARFAWLGGAPLITFAVAASGGLLLWGIWRRWDTARDRRLSSWRAGYGVAAAAAIVGLGLVVPVWSTAPSGGGMTVAVIQGSVPRLGLDFNAQRRAVLDNHVNATVDLARQVADGDAPQPDLVVWPENAADIDPLTNPDAAAEVQRAAETIDAPILLGTIQSYRDTGTGQNRNVSLLWDPDEGTAVFEYAKQHPVPFAEYIPMKDVVRTIAGWIDERMVSGIDRVHGLEAGTEPGVIPMGDATVSGIICFEIAYDGLVRESVTEGSNILAVQTNNATFNNAEATQQLAMVRIRAIEHGREGLMASTVGVSAFVRSDGSVYDETTFDEQAVIVSRLRLSTETTPATIVGPIPELVGGAAAVAILAYAAVARYRARRSVVEPTSAGVGRHND
ncbi:apolipoprotein N-acyltransferase [Stackebrandtia soli]|uniref:apolipoprotein N-acyltransferase n=1 Tax=Stackebrandtia soli TaxID=1892856 RepID=UPI0039ECCE2E